MAKKSKNRSMMRRDFSNTFQEQFADGAARAAYVVAWANIQEEKGKTYPGQDLMNVAPSTPLSAYVWAGELIGLLEAANKASLCTLGARAAKSVGVHWTSFDGENFGHYIAMQAMGTGVSWFDDHPRFKITVPPHEYYL
jgi:hypothetical protein